MNVVLKRGSGLAMIPGQSSRFSISRIKLTHDHCELPTHGKSSSVDVIETVAYELK